MDDKSLGILKIEWGSLVNHKNKILIQIKTLAIILNCGWDWDLLLWFQLYFPNLQVITGMIPISENLDKGYKRPLKNFQMPMRSHERQIKLGLTRSISKLKAPTLHNHRPNQRHDTLTFGSRQGDSVQNIGLKIQTFWLEQNMDDGFRQFSLSSLCYEPFFSPSINFNGCLLLTIIEWIGWLTLSLTLSCTVFKERFYGHLSFFKNLNYWLISFFLAPLKCYPALFHKQIL